MCTLEVRGQAVIGALLLTDKINVEAHQPFGNSILAGWVKVVKCDYAHCNPVLG